MNVKNKTGRVRIAYLSGVNLPGTLWKWYAVRTLQTSGSYKEIPRGGGCYPATHVLPTVTFLNYVETLLRITRKPCGRGNMPRSAERTRNRVFAAILFLVLSVLANPAYAVITCTGTTTSVNFGVYNTFSATPNDSGVGNVRVRCSRTGGNVSVATDIFLSTGGNGSTFASRRMASGVNRLTYNLYIEVGRTTVWTDVVGVHDNYLVTGTPVNKNYTVYGRIPALQTTVPAGTYNATINVTVNY